MIRVLRFYKVSKFLEKLEKNLLFSYLYTRILKLILWQMYFTHIVACILYYLATSTPAHAEGKTWMGSLHMGDYSYENFRVIGAWRRYVTSVYFAIVTMSTTGFGDIHGVSTKEMVVIVIIILLNMTWGVFFTGNMLSLIVRSSRTERFRNNMTDLLEYIERNKLGKDLSEQIKRHVVLQHERNYNEQYIFQDIPPLIRAKISQSLYKQCIITVPVFGGCSSEFINQIVIGLQEEHFLKGEVILEEGTTVDHLYFVSDGLLVCNGREATRNLNPSTSFGEIASLCNIPQPYEVRVRRICRILRLDKYLFTDILQKNIDDGRRFLDLLEANEPNIEIRQHITILKKKQEAKWGGVDMDQHRQTTTPLSSSAAGEGTAASFANR